MKGVRLALMAAAVTIGAATVAEAQQPGAGGGQGRGRGMGFNKEVMLKDITLDETKGKQVDSVVAVFNAKLQAMREEAQSSGADMQSVMPKMREIQQQRNEAIKSLLNDEQKKQFDKNAEEAAARRGRGPGGR